MVTISSPSHDAAVTATTRLYPLAHHHVRAGGIPKSQLSGQVVYEGTPAACRCQDWMVLWGPISATQAQSDRLVTVLTKL